VKAPVRFFGKITGALDNLMPQLNAIRQKYSKMPD